MATSADQFSNTLAPPLGPAPAHADTLVILLDLALEATSATGAALLAPAGDALRVLHSRGENAPTLLESVSFEGSGAGEAWYRGRLVISPELPPRGRQNALRLDERTIDVMAVPVTVDARPVAVLVLYHRPLGHFGRDDATTLTRLAEVAAGLWNGPASASVLQRDSVVEVRAAARMALLGASHLDDGDTLAEIAHTAGALLGVASARASVIEGRALVCLAGVGQFSGDIGRRWPVDFGFEGTALDSVEGMLATEWAAERGAGAAATPSSWIRSLVSVPLRRLDEVIGVVTVADDRPGRFTEADREALLRFAAHAAAAVTETRLAAAADRHDAEGKLATQVAIILAASEDTPALRRTIVSELRRVLAADGARLSEFVQQHVAVTAVDGDLPIILQAPRAGAELLCGHILEPYQPTHRCVLPQGEGYLLAAQLGQVTAHPGCLQVVRLETAFEPHEEALLRRLTEITELALLSRIANVRVSQYADRIRSVAEVSATLHQSLRPADAMGQAAEMLRRALAVSTVRLGLVDEVWQELVFPIDRRGTELRDGYHRRVGKGLLEEVWRTGRTFFFPQNAVAEVTGLGLTLDTAPRCIAVVPLRTRGTIAGVITIEAETDHAFEAEDVRILEIVAQQLGVTLENLESLEEERRQRITAEWLRQMARVATDPAARPTYVLELAADAAFQGIGGQSAVISLLPGDGTRVLVAGRGQIREAWKAPRPVAGTIAGWVLDEQGAVFVSANLAEDPRLSETMREVAGPMAAAAVPIWCDNRIIAVLFLARPVGVSFALGEVERLAQIADHAGAGYQTAQAGEALRKSEERYRQLFGSASDAIFTLDRDGTITSFNKAAERLWHVKAADVVGLQWEAVLPFESPAMVAEQVARAVAGESCVFEAWLRRPGGERGVAAMSLSPLVEQGRTTALLGIVRDVSDQREIQAQLLQAEKMSAIGQLVGGMAHEINNPLASILVNMELLLGEVRDPAQLETLTAIKTETDRAAQIVRNLLTYVRSQGSSRVLVDLRESIRGALALRRNQLLHQQIEVELELPGEPVLVSGNTVNLQQVLVNLLVNAEHAIRTHRARGQVWLRLSVNEGHAIVIVEDNGPGIPPELLSRVFDPFYTTKPEGEGTGLGLSVTAGIVADHQGRIGAAERPGGGARFVIELPLSQPGARTVAEEPVRPLAQPAPDLRRGRLLLIDDEPDIRRSISKFLTRTGWQVDLADSGEEGLRLLGKADYQVVLCDLRMPGLSGHEVYRQLQAVDSPAIARLVFMTGDVLSPEASRFLQEAGRPVLSKPFTLRDLTDALALVAPA